MVSCNISNGLSSKISSSVSCLEVLTLKIIPSAKQVIHIEVPPLLINGNVWPVTGNKLVATAIFMVA